MEQINEQILIDWTEAEKKARRVAGVYRAISQAIESTIAQYFNDPEVSNKHFVIKLEEHLTKRLTTLHGLEMIVEWGALHVQHYTHLPPNENSITISTTVSFQRSRVMSHWEVFSHTLHRTDGSKGSKG